MLEELHAASDLLSIALERYLGACTALHNACSYKSTINHAIEFSECVNQELTLVQVRTDKLTQAGVAVKNARNNLASVPINTLPPEVLVHIFRLVLDQQPCPLRAPLHWELEGYDDSLYLDTFTHVCSRWRQIALASRDLWSHIDITFSCPLSKGIHDRVATYIARAHKVPLDIHFVDSGRLTEPDDDSEEEPSNTEDDPSGWGGAMRAEGPKNFTFLARTQPQIRSLGLFIIQQYRPIHNEFLEYCLINSLSGGPSKLFIDVPAGWLPEPDFFETSLAPQPQNRASDTRFSSLLSEQQLENAWYSINTLSLKGRYPRWTSTAYQGLTDLWLLGRPRILCSELAGILSMSPGLRILHCDFEIYVSSQPALSTSKFPVALQELEELNLEDMGEGNVQTFLSWLKSGPKPLRLTLRANPTPALLKDFFAHSNVQEMRILVPHRILDLQLLSYDMFFLPSQLRTLVLIGWDSVPSSRTRVIVPPLGSHNTVPTELDTLCMLTCHYESFTQFRDVVAKYSPRRLVLWRCSIESSLLSPYKIIDMRLESTLRNDLAALCPSIEFPTTRDLGQDLFPLALLEAPACVDLD